MPAAFSNSCGASPPRLLSEGDLSPQQISAGAPELVQRSDIRGGQETASHTERPGPEAGLGRDQRPGGPPGGITGQRHRALQERGGGGKAPAGARPARRKFELARYLLVRTGRRGRQMPRATIRIDLAIRRFRQRQVSRPTLGHTGGPIDGGACQGMREGHPLTDCQQPVRRVYVEECDPESLAGASHQQWIPYRLGRGDEQQTPHSDRGGSSSRRT